MYLNENKVRNYNKYMPFLGVLLSSLNLYHI